MTYAQSHYAWLEKNLKTFFERAGASWIGNEGIIGAHGDKCYSYRYQWDEANVPFEHGVAIYLLTYVRPYRTEVRETTDGWVDPGKWVSDNYARLAPHFEGLEW